MATYIVGDLQGCFDELQLLLQQVHFNPAQDKLYLVGDLVARGDNRSNAYVLSKHWVNQHKPYWAITICICFLPLLALRKSKQKITLMLFFPRRILKT